MSLFLVLFTVFVLSYANGANDISKSIATLAGSGTTSYRKGIIWGTVWTAIGSLLSMTFASAMIQTFTGWLHPSVQADPLFPIGVGLGAMAWVLMAERVGMPVSTTHALVGAICGLGAFLYGPSNVLWAKLSGKVVLPLLVSPLMGVVLAMVIVRVVRAVFSSSRELAVCVVYRKPAVEPVQAGAMGAAAAALDTAAGELCLYYPTFARINANRIHWLSSGLTAFSRALNDTPKLAALAILYMTLAPETQLSQPLLYGLLALAMCLGGLLNGLRVTRTMAERITHMDDRDGLAANLSTTLLVTVAARLGLPVSTTHVANGSIIGVALRKGGVKAVSWSTVRNMLLAWVVTLPVSALLAIAFFIILRALTG